MSPGFKRDDLEPRYDVAVITEDNWHSHTGEQTTKIINRFLGCPVGPSNWLLNAGSGIYTVVREPWIEISLDLFHAPLQNHKFAACGSVEQLPFRAGVFGAIVCVGEVLAYCDPVTTIAEFARVLVDGGILICDFGSTKSPRYWFRQQYGRAADLVTDFYNGSPENIWIYDPDYIISLLDRSGLIPQALLGTHTWSALGRRVGLNRTTAMNLQKTLEWLKPPASWADVMTIVARRSAAST